MSGNCCFQIVWELGPTSAWLSSSVHMPSCPVPWSTLMRVVVWPGQLQSAHLGLKLPGYIGLVKHQCHIFRWCSLEREVSLME